jgi:hypothetical protein
MSFLFRSGLTKNGRSRPAMRSSAGASRVAQSGRATLNQDERIAASERLEPEETTDRRANGQAGGFHFVLRDSPIGGSPLTPLRMPPDTHRTLRRE